MTEPMVTTNNSKRVLSLSDQYRQVLNGKILDPSETYSFIGNFTDGWYAGGGIGNPVTQQTSVTRISYSTGTSVVSNRGNMTYVVPYIATSATNATDMWTSDGSLISNVQRITYANDMVNSSVRAGDGFTSELGAGTTAAANNTYAWFFRNDGSGGNFALISRLDFSNDMVNASVRKSGPSSYYGSYAFTARGNITDSWLFGGGVAVTRVLRTTFATDSDDPITKGNLTFGAHLPDVTGNTTDGWVIGANNPFYSTTNRVIYANDSISASNKSLFPIQPTYTISSCNVTDAWYSNIQHTSVIYRYSYANDTFTTSGTRLVSNLYGGTAK